MKVHFRVDEDDGVHYRITVFLNGSRRGRLVVMKPERVKLKSLVQSGLVAGDAVTIGLTTPPAGG